MLAASREAPGSGENMAFSLSVMEQPLLKIVWLAVPAREDPQHLDRGQRVCGRQTRAQFRASGIHLRSRGLQTVNEAVNAATVDEAGASNSDER